MAAPVEAYGANILKRVTIPSENIQMAKLLLEYGTDSNIKSLFHLDSLTKGRNISTGELTFSGRVSSGGVNSEYHKSTRIGITEIKGQNVLLDGGLNCKPEIPVFQDQEGSVTVGDVILNQILLRALLKSSYYNTTTGYTLSIEDVLVPTINQEIEFEGFAAAGEVLYTGDSIILEDRVMLTAKRQYDITLSITNEEGTSSSSLRITIVPGLVQLKFGATLDAAIAGTLTDVYVSQKISNANSGDGVVFYSNLAATEYSSVGYYVSTTPNLSGNYSYYRVTDSIGSVTEIGEYVNRYVDTYYYYSSVSVEEALLGTYVQRVLWYEILIPGDGEQLEKRQYYTSRSANAPYVASGFYVKADQTTSLEVLANGIAWVDIEVHP